jgi:hypothetical protein
VSDRWSYGFGQLLGVVGIQFKCIATAKKIEKYRKVRSYLKSGIYLFGDARAHFWCGQRETMLYKSNIYSTAVVVTGP